MKRAVKRLFLLKKRVDKAVTAQLDRLTEWYLGVLMEVYPEKSEFELKLDALWLTFISCLLGINGTVVGACLTGIYLLGRAE